MTTKIISGNILDAHTKYITHQTNCITRKSAHLAAAVFKQFPFADVYSIRPPGFVDTPGTIIIKGNGVDQRFVINMMGQFGPGKPRSPNSPKDGFRVRYEYFVSCLKHISQIENLESIAFPYRVGCGAAGGSWEFYQKAIDRLAELVKNKAEVFIYKQP